MFMECLNDEIIKLAKKLDINLVGFCKLEYFKDLENILKEKEKLGFKTSFEVGNVDDKTFKNSGYSSAIVIGIPYNKLNTLGRKENEVYFSSVAVGDDYHIILKEKLKFISDYLNDLGYKSFIGVDNNIYNERYLAFKAGLGFFGKNGMLINEKYGSFFYIGIILTDAKFLYSSPINKKCYECNKCVLSCPTNAISNNYNSINGSKCLSYITQKKNIASEEEKYINECVYGCDVCQNVCPHNENVREIKAEFINVNEFLNMSKDGYIRKYKNNSSFWRGKKIIDRNIKLYIENNLKK